MLKIFLTHRNAEEGIVCYGNFSGVEWVGVWEEKKEGLPREGVWEFWRRCIVIFITLYDFMFFFFTLMRDGTFFEVIEGFKTLKLKIWIQEYFERLTWTDQKNCRQMFFFQVIFWERDDFDIVEISTVWHLTPGFPYK